MKVPRFPPFLLLGHVEYFVALSEKAFLMSFDFDRVPLSSVRKVTAVGPLTRIWRALAVFLGPNSPPKIFICSFEADIVCLPLILLVAKASTLIVSIEVSKNIRVNRWGNCIILYIISKCTDYIKIERERDIFLKNYY